MSWPVIVGWFALAVSGAMLALVQAIASQQLRALLRMVPGPVPPSGTPANSENSEQPLPATTSPSQRQQPEERSGHSRQSELPAPIGFGILPLRSLSTAHGLSSEDRGKVMVEKTEPSTFERTRKAAILFALPLLLYLVLPYMVEVPESIRHVLLTLTAVMAVHLLDRIWLFRDTLKSLSEVTSSLANRVDSQTRALTKASSSLDAMARSGIIQLYASREEASKDIAADLADPHNTEIRLLGISLNDFIREQGLLAEAWRKIEGRIRYSGTTTINKCLVRVLLIDPECFGAQLRSLGESRKQHAMATRLRDEVNAVATWFLKLQEATGHSAVFECRLYRLPPILFLCHADDVCYVQQYHFWTERSPQTHVTRYARQPAVSPFYPMHEEMRQHFQWIWDKASVPVEDYLERSAIGIDKGAAQSGMVSVFLDHAVSKHRILSLLRSATKSVTIQGVSLRSFFSPGDLLEAIDALVEAEQSTVDVQVLLLDPDSQQAKMRAYREQLFVERGLSFADYCANTKTHEESPLYRDTQTTIKELNQWLTHLIARRQSGTPAWRPRIGVRKYSSAPACFALRVDDVVLVEQYHYGKDIPPKTSGGAPVILGKDMPLIEYQREASGLYDPVPHRSPFALIVDHLAFVYEHSIDVRA